MSPDGHADVRNLSGLPESSSVVVPLTGEVVRDA